MAETSGDRDRARKLNESALKDLDRALKLDRRDAASLVRRAELYLDMGDYLTAIGDCDKALEIDSDLADARVARARGFIEDGETEKAVADCDAVIKTVDKRLDAYVVRAKARVERSAEMRKLADIVACEKAADDCRQAISFAAKTPSGAAPRHRVARWSALAHELRGVLYDSLKARQKAFDEYTKAVSIDPALADALVRRALNRAKTEDFAGALADCNMAIEIDSSRPEGYFGRGMIHNLKREYAEALKDLDEAATRKYPKALGGLTAVYFDMATAEHLKAQARERSCPSQTWPAIPNTLPRTSKKTNIGISASTARRRPWRSIATSRRSIFSVAAPTTMAKIWSKHTTI